MSKRLQLSSIWLEVFEIIRKPPICEILDAVGVPGLFAPESGQGAISSRGIRP